MTDLPSLGWDQSQPGIFRYNNKTAAKFASTVAWDGVLLAIEEGWLEPDLSGRLVDREAIDYEAFRREYFGTQVPNLTTETRIKKAFVAALGGTND